MTRSKPVILSHIIGWIIFLSLPLLFLNNRSNNAGILSVLFSIKYLLFSLTYISLFYFNTYFLIPQLYLQKKFALYFIILLLLLIVVYQIKPFDQLVSRGPQPAQMEMPHGVNGLPAQQFRPPPGSPGPSAGIDAVSIFLFVMVCALGMAVRTTQQWRIVEQRALRAEAGKTSAELSFLKAQVNPHFLFNTLNNIYSMAVVKHEHTAESVMKLSNIMRYVTDDAAADFVPLEEEVNCIRDYIDLQRLRAGKKVTIDFTVTGDLSGKKIAPLIMMTFIENVFKYGMSNHEESPVVIRIFSGRHSVTFYSRNRIFSSGPQEPGTGIGIDNARRRLEHLYPQKYFIDIREDRDLFTVQLTLQA